MWGCLFQCREEGKCLKLGFWRPGIVMGGGLSVVSLTHPSVPGLAVWRSVLALIFLYQPPSSYRKQWLLAFPHPCPTAEVTNMQYNIDLYFFLSSGLPLNVLFYMFIIFEINWILRSYSGFIFKAKPKCPEPCKGQAFT